MAQLREMTTGLHCRSIFNFTLPLLLGNLLQQTYSLVDAAIVGKFLGINAWHRSEQALRWSFLY